MAENLTNGEAAFIPKITTEGALADVFRIFSDPSKSENTPDTELYPPNGIPRTVVYTDGSCENNGSDEPEAGAGILIKDASNDGEDLLKTIKIPNELGPSNNCGELIAIKEALESLPARDILIQSDSKYAIEGLTKHLESWKDRGYIGVENAHIIEVIAARLRARKARTAFKWVKGHTGDPGNEEADKLASLGRQKQQPDLIDMTIPPDLDISGAKLSKITQALAYRGIKNIKENTLKYQEARDRTSIRKNLAKAKRATKNVARTAPSEKQLWNSLKNKNNWKLLEGNPRI
ncbi:hypothetical protein AAF712_014385 [Marasmius tenuissimus]|uniref:ribonuclease H n=1 Tax=Marasmius tenuissimus TaxID=585030 RepID=A0ABR2ZC90_9AGAR